METINKFKFWCYKIIPLVYDDSLSYYEVLCKAVEKLNEVIDATNNIPKYITEAVKNGGFLDNLQEQFAKLNDGTSATATADRFTGSLIWLNGDLYKITRDMLAGEKYIVSSEGVTGNIEKLTFEEWTNYLLELVKKAITTNDEEYNDNSSKNYNVGDLLWWKGRLYQVTANITNSDSLVADKNIVSITTENLIKDLNNSLSDEIENRKELIEKNTTGKTQIKGNFNDVVITGENISETANKKLLHTSSIYEKHTTGDSTEIVGGTYHKEVTGNAETSYHENFSEQVDGDYNINSKNTTFETNGTLFINPTNPLKYGKNPEVVNGIESIPMIDGNGNAYRVPTTKNIIATGTYTNVEELGIRPNSVLSDEQIQALESLESTTLYFPTGIYTINSPLVFTKKISIEGNGSKIIAGNNMTTMLTINNPNQALNSLIQGKIVDLTLDCNNKATNGLFINGSLCYKISACKVENFTGIGITCGINNDSNAYTVVDSCAIIGNNAKAGIVDNHFDCVFTNCNVVNCKHGYELAQDYVSNCTAWINNEEYYSGSVAFYAKASGSLSNCSSDTMETGVESLAGTTIVSNFYVINNGSVTSSKGGKFKENGGSIFAVNVMCDGISAAEFCGTANTFFVKDSSHANWLGVPQLQDGPLSDLDNIEIPFAKKYVTEGVISGDCYIYTLGSWIGDTKRFSQFVISPNKAATRTYVNGWGNWVFLNNTDNLSNDVIQFSNANSITRSGVYVTEGITDGTTSGNGYIIAKIYNDTTGIELAINNHGMLTRVKIGTNYWSAWKAGYSA